MLVSFVKGFSTSFAGFLKSPGQGLRPRLELDRWGSSSPAAAGLLTGGSALGCSERAGGRTFSAHTGTCSHKHGAAGGWVAGATGAALSPSVGAPRSPSAGSSSAQRNSPCAGARGDFAVSGTGRAPERGAILRGYLPPDLLPPAYFRQVPPAWRLSSPRGFLGRQERRCAQESKGNLSEGKEESTPERESV